MTERLKPCPHCGRARLRSMRGPRDEWVHCENCKADGPPAKSWPEAVHLWNARANYEVDIIR